MLKSLLIKNYTLIENLKINPDTKFNIITGETGAGKSIVLGAVGLLLGNRADTKTLLKHTEKCIIEGEFDISNYTLSKLFAQEELDYEDTTLIRREISPSGKSRAFINDTPVTLDVLKKIGSNLIDVHSQHETINLGKSDFQLAFIDAFASTSKERKQYHSLYKDYKKKEKNLEQIKHNSTELGKEADYNNFLLDELVKLNLQPGEQTQLEEDLQILEHAEDIKSKLNEALVILNQSDYASTEGLQQGKLILAQLAKYSESYNTLSERLNSVFIELQDIVSELEKKDLEIEVDPEETQRVQERLSQLYALQKKHGVVEIEELFAIQKELEEKTSEYFNLDEEIQNSEKELEALKEKALQLASSLGKKRTAAFNKLETVLQQLLAEVGIGGATIKIENEQGGLNPYGIDNIRILFSANKGIAPQGISKVASGGEYSRLMFCVKYILADKIALPTIIFDEIDTGVSGEIALKLGAMMKKMAANHQLITISHLPQIAAKGDKHYYVYKETTSEKAISKIKDLDEDERITEIAKMIGGDNPSSIAFDNARELIKST